MRSALALLLLALLPLSSLRMVCLTTADTAPRPQADAAADAASLDECERICRRHPAATPAAPRPAPSVECLLVTDPQCHFLAGTAAAVLPLPPSLPGQPPSVQLAPSIRSTYRSPLPARLTPPPKTLA